jgi:hypothetical protein
MQTHDGAPFFLCEASRPASISLQEAASQFTAIQNERPKRHQVSFGPFVKAVVATTFN